MSAYMPRAAEKKTYLVSRVLSYLLIFNVGLVIYQDYYNIEDEFNILAIVSMVGLAGIRLFLQGVIMDLKAQVIKVREDGNEC